MRLATLFVAAACAAVLPAAHAQSRDIFLCVDAEGNKVFQNVGDTKNCKRMDVGPVLSVPAPRPSAVQRAAGSGEDRVTVSPASFPRVDRETQRVRDTDRRRVLEDELRAEEDRLARLKAEAGAEPERRDERGIALHAERVQRLREDIARTEGNLSALRRELALLRTQ